MVEVSAFVIGAIPGRPALIEAQNSPALLPIAEITPTPVITTLFTSSYLVLELNKKIADSR